MWTVLFLKYKSQDNATIKDKHSIKSAFKKERVLIAVFNAKFIANHRTFIVKSEGELIFSFVTTRQQLSLPVYFVSNV